jgi:hypothetical protein
MSLINDVKIHFSANSFAAAVYVAYLNSATLDELLPTILVSPRSSAYLISNTLDFQYSRQTLDKLYKSCLRKPDSAYSFGAAHKEYNGEELKNAICVSPHYELKYELKVNVYPHERKIKTPV